MYIFIINIILCNVMLNLMLINLNSVKFCLLKFNKLSKISDLRHINDMQKLHNNV